MVAKKKRSEESSVTNFLSGRGPNPLPEKGRGGPGPLGKKWLDEVMRDIEKQDRSNERKARLAR